MITNQAQRRSPAFLNNFLSRQRLQSALVSALLAAGVLFFSFHGVWPAAVMLVLAVELLGVQPGQGRSKALLARVPAMLVGGAIALIIAMSVHLASQAAIAGLYALWRWWWSRRPEGASSLPNLLAVQAVIFEAIFLVAAEWRNPEGGVPEWAILLLVWVCAYLSVYSVLVYRGERAAGVMAATWALVATEISWVLLRWLYLYTVEGGYLVVPQPALILTALAYCYGSIYVSQRQGKLSRGRLTEYLLIGLILIAIVITGTPWKGSL